MLDLQRKTQENKEAGNPEKTPNLEALCGQQVGVGRRQVSYPPSAAPCGRGQRRWSSPPRAQDTCTRVPQNVV